MLQLSDVRPISDVRHQRGGWRPPYLEDLQNRQRTSDRIRTSDASDVRHMMDVRHEGPREETPNPGHLTIQSRIFDTFRTSDVTDVRNPSDVRNCLRTDQTGCGPCIPLAYKYPAPTSFRVR